MVADSHLANNFKREVFRKSLHLPTLLFPALAYYLPTMALALLMALAILYLVNHFFYPQLLAFFVSRSSRHLGQLDPAPLYLCMGMALLIYYCPTRIQFFGAYLIAIADSAAALIGVKYGHKIARLSKSYEGTAFFALLSYIGAYTLSGNWQQALYLCVLLTLIELISHKGLDNLLLPVALILLKIS